MSQASKKGEHSREKAKPVPSTEELRARAKEVLEKASQVLKESGTLKGFPSEIQGEKTE